MTAVTQLTNVHTRTTPDMLHVIEVNNVLIAVLHGVYIQFLFVYHMIAKLSCNCFTLLAPTNTDVTPSCAKIHANASCAIVRP